MNAFEILSQGRIIDLGSRITPEQLTTMSGLIRRTCTDCEGTGLAATIGILTPIGILALPVPCDLCDGSGVMAFISQN